MCGLPLPLQKDISDTVTTSCLVSGPIVDKEGAGYESSISLYRSHLSLVSQVCLNVCVTHRVALPLFTRAEVQESAI